jgi:hypothetical protein
MASTRIEGIALRPFAPAVESDAERRIGKPGMETAVATAPGDRRGLWEGGLVARAFARRSHSLRLPKVIWLKSSDSGITLEYIGPGATPLQPDAIDRFEREVEAAAEEGSLKQVDVLWPQGVAFALFVHVQEPHSFLRSRSPKLFASLSDWRPRCDGIYAEISDARSTPVLTVAWFQDGGAASIRHDVECCAPPLGLSGGVGVASPSCPVFG